jgi:hypothetical protein
VLCVKAAQIGGEASPKSSKAAKKAVAKVLRRGAKK